MYDEVALARWIEEAVRKAGITVLLGAVMRGVRRDGGRIVRELELATRYGDVTLAATGFVDATGDAALTWKAGFACREPADGPIYGTQMMVLEGIDEAQQPSRDEFTGAAARRRPTDYGLVRTRAGLPSCFPGRGIALVNLTHVETPLDPVAASTKSPRRQGAGRPRGRSFCKRRISGGVRQGARAHLRHAGHPPDALDRRPPAAHRR